MLETENRNTCIKSLFKDQPFSLGRVTYDPNGDIMQCPGTIMIDIPQVQDIPKWSMRRKVLNSYDVILSHIWEERLPIGKTAYFTRRALTEDGKGHDVFVMICKMYWHDDALEVLYGQMLMAIANVCKTLGVKELLTTAPPIRSWRFPVRQQMLHLGRIFMDADVDIRIFKGD